MTDLNHVVLIGRLTRDLGSDERSFGYVQSGQARANVSIAVNRSRKQADGSWGDEVNYFDVTIWGKNPPLYSLAHTLSAQIASIPAKKASFFMVFYLSLVYI